FIFLYSLISIENELSPSAKPVTKKGCNPLDLFSSPFVIAVILESVPGRACTPGDRAPGGSVEIFPILYKLDDLSAGAIREIFRAMKVDLKVVFTKVLKATIKF